MSKLVQETDQGAMNHHHDHICVLCDKSFPSGRSLGGHMRSHVINSTNHHNNIHMIKKKMKKKKLSFVNNELMKDPNKTPKVKDSREVSNNNDNDNNNDIVNGNKSLVVLDKICKECGKGFQSWKALFGHMKCHSEKVMTKNNVKQDYLTSHSENQNSSPIKKSRSKRYKVNSTTVTTTTTITTASSSYSMNVDNNNNINDNSTSIVSDIEQDQESEVAICLIMLSRDEGKLGKDIDTSDYCNSSAFVKLTKVEGKKGSANGSKIKKIVETEISDDYFGRSELGATGFEKILIQSDEFDDKKRKFECITCNKSFYSYQALGGHKASHNKLKESLDSKLEAYNTSEDKHVIDHELMINAFGAKPIQNDLTTKRFNIGGGSLKKKVVLGTHECPLCFKVFSSGQALGGHKRSHMIAEAKLNQQTSMNLIEKVNEPVCETRGFIDLNMLPCDTMEEDMIIKNNTTEYKPWHWVDTADHESTTLLGLLSTS